ncbi:MAG: zeta toxin family protein [Desulfobacterales bacterium]
MATTVQEQNTLKNCVVIAGSNGSGKTTFAKSYFESYPYDYLNADEIAAEMNSNEPEKVRIQAGRLFFRNLSVLIEEGKNVIIESTLSGRGFHRILKELRNAGYDISIIFIFLETPELCLARVRERVRKGGHNVSERDVVRRFYRSIKNFWNIYREEADLWHLFYNAGEHFEVVAFGERSSYLINNEELFNLFLQEVKL